MIYNNYDISLEECGLGSSRISRKWVVDWRKRENTG